MDGGPSCNRLVIKIGVQKVLGGGLSGLNAGFPGWGRCLLRERMGLAAAGGTDGDQAFSGRSPKGAGIGRDDAGGARGGGFCALG